MSSRPKNRDLSGAADFIRAADGDAGPSTEPDPSPPDAPPPARARRAPRPSTPHRRDLQPPQKPRYPWESPRVRDDVQKSFLLRLTEADKLKLEYVAAEHGTSQNQLVLEALLPYLDHYIE